MQSNLAIQFDQSILVIDLDDCLAKTDLLDEQILGYLKLHPLKSGYDLFRWALQGKAILKRELARHHLVDIESIPLRASVLDLINQAKAQGHTTILATGSHISIAEQVAERVGLFDQVIATNAVNLRGQAKANEIKKVLNGRAFRYVGDHHSDIHVWSGATYAYAVNPSTRTLRLLKAKEIPFEVLTDRAPNLRTWKRALRMHQWMKNVLIFLPLSAGHHFLDFGRWWLSLLAAGSFSLLASTVYLINDLTDLSADRAHATKRGRPLASGDLGIRSILLAIPALLSLFAFISIVLPEPYWIIAGSYLAINLVYTLHWKRVIGLDVVVLGVLYTVRILAGGAAADIVISQWLLAFSSFFFFGLALVKRYVELSSATDESIRGRGYQKRDSAPVLALGAASSLLSVLVLVLYFNSSAVSHLYQHSARLWPVAPILLFWIGRIWLLAHRGEVHDDPVIFAIKDQSSWIALLALAVILFSAV